MRLQQPTTQQCSCPCSSSIKRAAPSGVSSAQMISTLLMPGLRLSPHLAHCQHTSAHEQQHPAPSTDLQAVKPPPLCCHQSFSHTQAKPQPQSKKITPLTSTAIHTAYAHHARLTHPTGCDPAFDIRLKSGNTIRLVSTKRDQISLRID